MVGGRVEPGSREEIRYIIATALKKLAVQSAPKIFINFGAPSLCFMGFSPGLGLFANTGLKGIRKYKDTQSLVRIRSSLPCRHFFLP